MFQGVIRGKKEYNGLPHGESRLMAFHYVMN